MNNGWIHFPGLNYPKILSTTKSYMAKQKMYFIICKNLYVWKGKERHENKIREEKLVSNLLVFKAPSNDSRVTKKEVKIRILYFFFLIFFALQLSIIQN